MPNMKRVLALLLVALLMLSGCRSAKKGVIKDLGLAQGMAHSAREEAVRGDAQLAIAEPIVDGTPAETPVKEARKSFRAIERIADKAGGLLEQTRSSVQDDLQDIPMAWWMKFLVIPLTGILILVAVASFGSPILAQYGVPGMLKLAKWLARYGLASSGSFAAKVHDALKLPDEQAMEKIRMDQMDTRIERGSLRVRRKQMSSGPRPPNPMVQQ